MREAQHESRSGPRVLIRNRDSQQPRTDDRAQAFSTPPEPSHVLRAEDGSRSAICAPVARTRVWWLVLGALMVLCFGLAAGLDTWFQGWQGNRTQSADVLSVMLGDGRRIFAQHFFVKADAYFHSGYYPSVFDNREAFQTPHMAADAGAVGEHNQGDETGFL